MGPKDVVDYYRRHAFNPVPVDVEDRASWLSHFERRRNLYQHHLQIPLAFLRGRRVLEFGCNSGENSLVLAAAGAELVLVEPNDQVVGRLRDLFRIFAVEKQLAGLHVQDIAQFSSDEKFDLVIAEGFLSSMSGGLAMLDKVKSFVGPHGGIGVVSFNDRCGALMEFIRIFLLCRVYELEGLADVHGSQALALAEDCFGEDFRRSRASRPFAVWWKDTLVNPFVRAPHIWHYPQVLERLYQSGAEFYSSSPRWSQTGDFFWYKNICGRDERYEQMQEEWRRKFGYFITGTAPAGDWGPPVERDVIAQVGGLVEQISAYAQGGADPSSVIYPAALEEYFRHSGVPAWQDWSRDLKIFFDQIHCRNARSLISVYHGCATLRQCWGTPYHYISFISQEQNGARCV